MIRAAVLSHRVREPYPLDIKIITQFAEIQQLVQDDPNSTVARLYLYTNTKAYGGRILRGDINKQVAWSDNFIKTLVDSLSGRRSNIDLRFSQVNAGLDLICQIESGIRITMFKIQLKPLEDQNPFEHMKKVMLHYKKLYLDQENRNKQEKDKILGQIKEMQALGKQIEEQTQTQVLHLKRNFVDVINQCKKQLRKHMKTGISEIAEEEEEETMTKGRTIIRVDRCKLEKMVSNPSNKMEIEYQNSNKGFQDLFDDFD